MELYFIKNIMSARHSLLLPMILGCALIASSLPQHHAWAETAESPSPENSAKSMKSAKTAKNAKKSKTPKSAKTNHMSQQKTPDISADAKAITIFSHAPDNHPERTLLASTIAEWNRNHPDKPVSLMPAPADALTNPLVEFYAKDAAAQADLAGNLPDIVDFYGANFASVAAREGLLPLNDVLPKTLLDNFEPAFLRLGQYPENGYIYALPMIENSLAIWARKSALMAIDARIPTSVNDAWSRDEFEEILKNLATLPKVTYPLDVGLKKKTGVWDEFAFVPWIIQMEGDIFDPKTQKTQGSLNSPASVAALAYLKSLLQQKLIAPADAKRNEAHPLTSIPMLYSGPWMATLLNKAHKDDYLLLPIPKLGPIPAAASVGWMFGINNNSKNPKEAGEFLAFLLSPRKIGDMSNRLGGIPATRDALKYSRYYNNASLQLFLDQFANAPKTLLPHPNYAVISNEFSQALQTIIKGGDIQEILGLAATNIDNAIASEHKQ
ncbi:MAG: extracellular solute-binding protein [Alphaproteobacteria bacterium]|nr:extracellular solute-binding protein [Alphaproteobacteria bacterium]